MEDGLGLTTITGLLAVITTLTLREQRSLSCLVLCQISVCEGDGGYVKLLTSDLVLGVLLAVLALAVGSSGLGNVDLRWTVSRYSMRHPFSSLARNESSSQPATQSSVGPVAKAYP